LAVEMGFVSPKQLSDALSVWSLDQSKSLADILQERKLLADEQKSLLESLVTERLRADPNQTIVPATNELKLVGFPSAKPDSVEDSEPTFQTRLGEHAPKPVDKADEFATRVEASLSTTAPPTHTQTQREGRFEVVRAHARGGLGEVFVARDRELNREVALKEIQSRHADNLESRDRFMIEAEITGVLEHPGIVPVYSLGTYPDGRPFYAMRFIRGQSLQEALDAFHKAEGPHRDPSERSLALRSLLRRFVDVCQAMAYAHCRGVLHRDLKPGNVMLGEFGETLVVDWGLAKLVGAATPAGTTAAISGGSIQSLAHNLSTHTMEGIVVGTPHFMPPEQAGGKIDELSPASDVYSLGATLYALLVGKAPLSGIDVMTVLERVVKGDVPPARSVNPTIPPPLEAICQKAMALQPTDRYQSAKEFANDVEQWLADEPTSVWKEPWTMRARRWAKRHRTLVSTGSAVLVVGGISLILATVLLTAANRRERAAKLEAQANYQLARRAVDRYHTDVSEDVLLHEPGMQPLRRKLLEAAQEFYGQFSQQEANNPAVKAELGRAMYRLGRITADIDTPAKAGELYQHALAHLNELPSADRVAPEIAATKASCLHQLGKVFEAQDQLPAARESYTAALQIWSELQQAEPDNERYRAEEARTRMGLGNAEQVARKLDAAKQEYETALAIRDQLASANPKRDDYARDRASSRHNLAMIQTYTSQQKEAEVNFKAALAAQEKLIHTSPKLTQYQADAARTHVNLASLYALSERKEEAVAEYEVAAKAWEQLADSNPLVHRFRANQGKTLLSLCRVLESDKHVEAVTKTLNEVKKLYQRLGENDSLLPMDRVDVASGLRQIASVLDSMGELADARTYYNQAITLLEPHTRDNEALPEYLAELARAWHNLGVLEKTDSKPDAARTAFQKALTIWQRLVDLRPDNPDYKAGLNATRRNLGGAGGGDIVTQTLPRLPRLAL
jgi:serine/threonine protein kinase/tetratricopeptide (TPR) repeat protein